MLKIIFYCFLGLCALGIAGFVAMFSSMIFISPISDGKLRTLSSTKTLTNDVAIKEVIENSWATETWRDYRHTRIRPYGEGEGRVDPHGIVWPEFSYDQSIETKHARILDAQGNGQPLILVSNKIYTLEINVDKTTKPIGKLGKLQGELDNKIGHIDFAEYINEKILVATIYRADIQYAKVELIQIDLNNYSYITLTEEPTFTSDFPPITASINDGETQLLVYFDDVLSWGFGGSVHRPKYQFVRLFNSANPMGLDIAKISLKDGVIFRVWEDKGIIYYLTDPNMPSSKTQKPSRLWTLTLNAF